jgi:uncharacterized protein (TIGR00369 family)
MKLEAKRISDSQFTLSALMNPEDANPLGNVHGGVIMKLVDEAGGIVAMRHAGHPVVTVAVDSMRFIEPIVVGNLVQCAAAVSYVGRTSIEVRVNVTAENPYTGEAKLTNTAYLVYVALNEQGEPTRVPGLVFETEEERKRARMALQRQRFRKQQQQQEEANGVTHE